MSKTGCGMVARRPGGQLRRAGWSRGRALPLGRGRRGGWRAACTWVHPGLRMPARACAGAAGDLRAGRRQGHGAVSPQGHRRRGGTIAGGDRRRGRRATAAAWARGSARQRARAVARRRAAAPARPLHAASPDPPRAVPPPCGRRGRPAAAPPAAWRRGGRLARPAGLAAAAQPAPAHHVAASCLVHMGCGVATCTWGCGSNTHMGHGTWGCGLRV
jgi:hypothetical protein